VIELDAFSVAFPGFSLGPLSVTLHAGERVALVGPNGAGKSTTLRGIAGLLPRMYRGRIRVHGVEVSEAGPEIRRTVGLLPELLGGFGWMTVGEHLAFLRAFHTTWDDAWAEELTARLELPTRTKLANLSKGMRVKLSLVSVEAYRPPVLLLDEPTAGIDPVMRRSLLALLRECAPAGGTRTVVFSSHILEDVEAVSDRVLLLREGRLVGDESVVELRSAREGASVSEQLMRRLGAEAAR